MPDPVEPSQEGQVVEPEPQASASLPKPASEPRQSEEARRIQAAKDAEIARMRREFNELARQNEELQAALGMAQAQTLPDEQQRFQAAYQQQVEQNRRQMLRLRQEKAMLEVKLQHKDADLDDTDLRDAVRTTKNEDEFRRKVGEMVEKRKKDKEDREAELARLREEARAEARKEVGADRISTSTPTASPIGPDTEYRKIIDEARQRHDPALAIRAIRQRAIQ